MFKVKALLVSFACLLIVGCSSLPAVKKGQSLDQYLDSVNFSGAVLVSYQGEIVHAAGYGFANRERKIRNTPETPFYIASLTKQFTALAILQLQERQQLHLDDPIAHYLPDYPEGEKITIRQLLNHSAGLYDFTDQWDEIKRSNMSTQDIIDLFKEQPLEFEPGTDIRYSSSGYILAGRIIEVVSGKRYEDYVASEMFLPLNMVQSGYGDADLKPSEIAMGYVDGEPQTQVNMSLPYAAGSLVSSVADFYLWDQALRNRTLFNSDSLQEIYPADRNAPGLGFGSGKFNVVMGLGWGVYETEYGPEYSHTGNVDGFSTVVSRYPEQNAMIVILSNQDRFDVFTLKNRIADWVLVEH